MGFQRMNRKGLEFKSSLFAIVAFSLIVVAFGVIISEQATFYSTDATSQISSFNKLNNLSGVANQQRGSVSPNDPDPGSDAEASTFRGVYGILAGLYTTFDLVLGSDGMIAEVVELFGLPAYVRQGIITFMLLGITFALVAVIFRLSKGSA